MRKRIIVLCFSISCCLAAQTKSGEQGDTAQEAAVIELLSNRVHYENDGTGFIETTHAVRVQSEAGIQRYGQLALGYNSATEKLDVNYVRVRKPGGQVVDTPAANAQDFAPEILQSAPMYSDYRERHITVVGLRPGDVLQFRYTRQVNMPLAAGEFWFEYSFPKGIAVTDARLEIDVPKAREVILKSLTRKYSSAESGDRRVYTWSVKNIAPDRQDRDNDKDEDAEESEEQEFPDVQLTTFKNWQQIAHWYAQLQGERVVVDDAIRKKAAELTRGAATPLEKAHRIYDYVARNIRYVSLSFGVGRYQPHAASEVLAGSYGDCKDKHTLLSALLRAAGITSYPVLIDSSRKLDEDVPSPAQFDHVITLAQIDKDSVWLDSTAEVAPFGLIMYPLRDKQAVLAAPDVTGGLRKTTADAPVKNTLTLNLEGKVSETGALDSVMEILADGDSAVRLRAILRGTPQADWQKFVEGLSVIEGYRGKVSDIDATALEEPAKPLRLRYKLHQDTYFLVPSSNFTYYAFPPLSLPVLSSNVWYPTFPQHQKKSKEPLDVGPVAEVHSKTHLEFASNFSLRLPPEVAITRDYGQYSLTYRLTNNVLDAERTLIIKVNRLPASRRGDVESLRNVALNYVEQSITCDARPASKAALASVAPVTGTPQELRKAGIKALERRDFSGAAELLKRVVDQKPNSEEAWDELGRAYAALGNHAEAISAYRKQVEVDPFHKRAWNDLGAELRVQGKYEDALAAYSKQIENVPVDGMARKNRGMLLLRLKRQKEAMAELEKALAASPDDPETQLALAQLYEGAGSREKSRPLLLSVAGTTALPPGGDWFSAALRDDIDPDRTVRDARKIIDSIGEQFDGGPYDEDPPEALSAMYFLSLEWARIGWAEFLKGNRMEGMRYLESAWSLSQSGTVASRLARIYTQAGDSANAKHMLSLAVAAGGAEAENSKTQLAKLGPIPDLAPSQAELLQMRSVKVAGLAQKTGQAEFILLFDGSSKPQRVDYRQGAADMRSAEQALVEAAYPVPFPDNSSAKVVRKGELSCSASGCVIALQPVENLSSAPGPGTQPRP